MTEEENAFDKVKKGFKETAEGVKEVVGGTAGVVEGTAQGIKEAVEDTKEGVEDTTDGVKETARGQQIQTCIHPHTKRRKTENITKQEKNWRMQEIRLKPAQKQLQTKSKILTRI